VGYIEDFRCSLFIEFLFSVIKGVDTVRVIGKELFDLMLQASSLL